MCRSVAELAGSEKGSEDGTECPNIRYRIGCRNPCSDFENKNWMSTNSKFETARCDDKSDGGSDVDDTDDAALVSTILGSDCETHDMIDDLSSCMDSDYDGGEFGDSFDWPCATEEVLVGHGFQRATPTRRLKIFTICAGTDAPVKSLEESIGKDCVDHFASCDINNDCLGFVQANFAPRHFYRDVTTLLGPHAYCAICEGPCIAFHEETADVMCAGRSRKFRVV